MATLIRVLGVVQGVGFRPFIYQRAVQLGFRGWVRNDGLGVTIYLSEDVTHDEVVSTLLADPPPSARIDTVGVTTVTPTPTEGFQVLHSETTGTKRAEIPTDLAICADCRTELFDPADRRYLYPYINCTNCGPRYSVVQALPYDRLNTTMAPWQLCEACQHEYTDPSNRRFHAEPIACSGCGPTYRLITSDANGMALEGQRAIKQAATDLRNGHIIAVKGIGGYLLACDATNASAVEQLRVRKFRKDKPFALMAKDIQAVRTVAHPTAQEERLLVSSRAPIVLLEPVTMIAMIAPEAPRLGFMLGYAPIHLLLFHYGAPDILVMTSGNRSSEPMIIDNEVALELLDGIADAILLGERPIARRVDDSVAQLDHQQRLVLLRRARGFAPARVTELGAHPGVVLGCGADLKSTVTISIDGIAHTSPYLGDLSYRDVQQAHRQSVADMVKLFDLQTSDVVLVTDAHPDYHAHRLADAYAEQFGVDHPLEIQHHRAHIASVAAEHQLFEQQILGVAFDGTGYGDDGTTWGGEFLTGTLSKGLQRIAHIEVSTLPGGDAAARFPLQCLFGFVDSNSWNRWIAPQLTPEIQHNLEMAASFASHLTTSVGRLFDAMAAILGYHQRITYEGQAAIWLEALASEALSRGYLPRLDPLLTFRGRQIRYREYFAESLERAVDQCDRRELAADFHYSLAHATVTALDQLKRQHASEVICLSGGVFQNVVLRDAIDRLYDRGLYYNESLSCNDENISLGQVALVTSQRRTP
ncbi:carbamoyltransferase HypF [Ferrimicrobium sp.]|uniref:carbamoyltransferase HypF n=1 Tax=Ferrimicrobium sp. TaxID=2926050 RepID=UPI002638C659|nr:carbamoyltransferase HypF [Ferrimicrobium sp.]